MSGSFPPYEHDALSKTADDVVTQLGDYGEILEDGHDRGLFGVTPKTEDARPMDDARRRTIAMQLWLLGYLQEKPEKRRAGSISQSALRDALQQFRDEAGLPERKEKSPDAIDDDTWYALNELVAFEGMEGTELTEERLRERWIDGGEPRPALQRAVQLRLFVLGLRENRPDAELDPPRSETLEPFLWINLLFKLDEDPLPQGYFPKTVAILFNQDRFVQKLSKAGTGEGDFEIHRPSSLSDSKTQQLAQSFIVNVAKIELWLLGFDVELDGKNDYSVSGFQGEGRKIDLEEALQEYWQELEKKSAHEVEQLSQSITAALFRSLQETAEVAEQIETDPHADYSQEVVEEHLTTEGDIEKAWAEVQERRLSLWDGLKRVWRWIKRGVKKIVSWIGSFFKNLARAFYRYASKGYKIVRLAVTSVAESVKYYVGGGLASEPEGTVVLLNETDFDATVYVDEGTDAEALRDFYNRLQRKTDVFEFGARILGVAFQTIRQIASGIVGWARLLKSLVKSLRDLKPYYEQLKDARSPART